MSAHLNTVSGTIYEDLIVKVMGKRFSEFTASVIMKLTVIVIGVTCGVLVVVVEQLNGILQASFVVIRSIKLYNNSYLSLYLLDGS